MDAGRIRTYDSGKKTYFEVVNWLVHQKIDRPSKVAHPIPPWGPNAAESAASAKSGTRESLNQAAGPVSQTERVRLPFCSRHPNGTDLPCKDCGNLRLALMAAAARGAPVATLPLPPRAGDRSGFCASHNEYPTPCDQCMRIRAEAAAAA
ncbi:hypothetical protein RCH22_003042 [Cryobacterium psychrotolerans]|nr:hypothetical protein [Cryobacterium psychrotolerans]